VLGLSEGKRSDSRTGLKAPLRHERQATALDGSAHRSVYYRNTGASDRADGPCVLTAEQSIEKAACFVEDNGIASLDELTLDSVVTISRMVATGGGNRGQFLQPQPEAVGYIVVLKRGSGRPAPPDQRRRLRCWSRSAPVARSLPRSATTRPDGRSRSRRRSRPSSRRQTRRRRVWRTSGAAAESRRGSCRPKTVN